MTLPSATQPEPSMRFLALKGLCSDNDDDEATCVHLDVAAGEGCEDGDGPALRFALDFRRNASPGKSGPWETYQSVIFYVPLREAFQLARFIRLACRIERDYAGEWPSIIEDRRR